MYTVVWQNSIGVPHYRSLESFEEVIEGYVGASWVHGLQVFDSEDELVLDQPYVDPFLKAA